MTMRHSASVNDRLYALIVTDKLSGRLTDSLTE